MYAIMGATGNVGSKVADILLTRGEKVRVIARSEDKLKPSGSRGADPAAGDAVDATFLTRAFKGADAVFTIIPPNLRSHDYRAYQNRIGESIAEAIRNAGVTYVVNLSSLGADLPEGTGPIKGLYDQEQRLNKIEGVNVLHLRPTFYMENLLWNIDMIISKGVMGGAIRADVKMPMIATRDVAKIAADYLAGKNFSGKSAKEFLGQRDLALEECAKIVGQKIGKPDLRFVTFSYDDAYKGLLSSGLSENVGKLFVEMNKAINEGLFGAGRTPRTPENTTETPFEEFAENFARMYKERAQKAA